MHRKNFDLYYLQETFLSLTSFKFICLSIAHDIRNKIVLLFKGNCLRQGCCSCLLSAVPSCPSSNNFPGKPFDVRWSTYSLSDSTECVPYFNFTWRMPQDGNTLLLTCKSVQFLEKMHRYG